MTFFDVFQNRYKEAMPLTPPTLKQQAARVVLLKELPTSGLPPKTLRQDFEALAQLPGNYTVIENSVKGVRVDGAELTPAEGAMVSIINVKLNNLCSIGSKITVSTTTNSVEREWKWSDSESGTRSFSFILETKLVRPLMQGSPFVI